MSLRRLAPVLLLLPIIAACEDQPTTPPTVGSGTKIEATINGRSYPFALSSVEPPTYNPTLKISEFAGVYTGNDTTRTLRVSIAHDLDDPSLPETLTGADVTITFIEKIGQSIASYTCPVGAAGCVVNLLATNGSIIDGTFTAQLADPNDTTKQVSITNGIFSVKVR